MGCEGPPGRRWQFRREEGKPFKLEGRFAISPPKPATFFYERFMPFRDEE